MGVAFELTAAHRRGHQATMRQVREFLRLKFVGGVPTREIARRIGVAASTVRTTIRRFQAGGLSCSPKLMAHSNRLILPQPNARNYPPARHRSPGDIMSEYRATSSRNARATSSKSAS